MAFTRSKREEQVKKLRRVSFCGLVKNGATHYSSDEESKETRFFEENKQRGKKKLNGINKLNAISHREIESDSEDSDMDDEESDETDDAEETEKMENALQEERALMRKLSKTIKVEIVDNEDELISANDLGAYKPQFTPKEDSQPLKLELAKIFNPPRVAQTMNDKPKIKIKEEPTDISSETELLLPVKLIKCGVEYDSEATLSADESRMYMKDSDTDYSRGYVAKNGMENNPMDEHNYSTPSDSNSSPFFRKRTAIEEMLVLYDFIKSGLDREDRMYLRHSFDVLHHDPAQRFWLKGTRWTHHPISIPLSKKEPTSLRTHVSGCARCEGYYKLNVEEKAFSNKDSLLMSWSYL